LGYWEVPEDEQPPMELYGNDDRLAQWWEDVKAIRAEKYKTPGKEPLEEVPLMQNELELPKFW
jgi:hypothetical protein